MIAKIKSCWWGI